MQALGYGVTMSTFQDGTSNTIMISERVQDCFTTLNGQRSHFYTTWADPISANWFTGGTLGDFSTVYHSFPNSQGVYPPNPAPVATHLESRTTGRLRVGPDQLEGQAYLWGIQDGVSTNNCRRTNFSSGHAGGVQVLYVDGSVHNFPASMDLATLFFLSTPANSDLSQADL